jgi:hypothetical protein
MFQLNGKPPERSGGGVRSFCVVRVLLREILIEMPSFRGIVLFKMLKVSRRPIDELLSLVESTPLFV